MEEEDIKGMSLGEQRACFEADLWNLILRYMAQEFDLDAANVIMTLDKVKYQIIERISDEEKKLWEDGDI